ncbi:hypothetical protein Fcan01_16314 [Folsomia candida]|uniref:Uncharacterized protein n=1 Tax=Folsomia candida TaxID=158441 RepID=A0A226DWW4_FOLCA|nr:hypothetical protein Fcan01_16314 [Folsomia candida]
MNIILVLVPILFLSASPAHAGILTDQGSAIVNATKSLQQLRSQMLDSFLGIISNYTNTGLASLHNAANVAAELGVDITEILSEAAGKLNNFTDQTIQKFGQEVDTIMSDALGALQVDINKVNQMITKIRGYPLKLSKCLISLRPVTCLTNLIKDARNDLNSVPSRLADIAGSARNTIDAAATNFQNLTQQSVTDVLSSINKIVDDANQAVDDVIHGAPSTMPGGIVGTGN